MTYGEYHLKALFPDDGSRRAIDAESDGVDQSVDESVLDGNGVIRSTSGHFSGIGDPNGCQSVNEVVVHFLNLYASLGAGSYVEGVGIAGSTKEAQGQGQRIQ